MPISQIVASSIASGAIPDSTASGTVVPWGGTSAPTGWLDCDGSAVSRSTYADLFTAIGTTYGVGDGSSTFNIPDIRGRTVCGKDNMGGTAANRLTSGTTIDGATLGTAGGSQTHTLSAAEMPAHRHGLAVHDTSGQNDYLAGSNSNYGFQVTSNSTYASTTSVGSGSAHVNVQPSIVLNYIIKT
jgi:microcystin-dependent protein